MKINPDKLFLQPSENSFCFCNWQDITQGRRILLASVTRPQSHFTPTYVAHLRIWSDMYRLWGVDQVYLITGSEKFNLLWINNMSKGLSVLGDVEDTFVSELAQHCGVTGFTGQQLSRYWNYQVLLNCGQPERVYFQPMQDLVRHLVRHTRDLGLARLIQKIERSHLTPYFLRTNKELMQKTLYYNLYPNTDLKNYLLTASR